MSKKKPEQKEEAEVHEELKGFQIKIDPFGQLESNVSIDTIKEFLDRNVDDKKLNHLKSKEEE